MIKSDGESKELDFPEVFNMDKYTSLLMSNGYEKVFMYKPGVLYEISNGHIKDFSVYPAIYNDFCDKLKCKFKFDNDGSMYFRFANRFKNIWIRVPYTSYK